MTNRKSTKKALLTSCLALLLCFSMLVGTTFAWFTDSVESGVNKIIAGNLDVDVLYENDEGKMESIQGVDELFDDVTLWEPGVVAYENLTVTNLGTLALKYGLGINFSNENQIEGTGAKLSQILKIAVVPGGVDTEKSREEIVAGISNWKNLSAWYESGKLLPKDKATEKEPSTATYGVVIWWQPSDEDNNWNVNNNKTTSDGQPLHIDLGISLTAWQLEHESDSFGSNYDANLVVTTVADANARIAAGESVVLFGANEPDGIIEIHEGYTGTVTLSNVSIKSVQAAGDANIVIDGVVTVNANGSGVATVADEEEAFNGSAVYAGGKLAVSGNGTLTAIAADVEGAAGIYGETTQISNITIDYVAGSFVGGVGTDTKYYKDAPEGGAAIGGKVITLDNVTVSKAIGGSKAAGIGARYWTGVSITITNSTIGYVEGGVSAAGIGGSRVSSEPTRDQDVNITIVDSTITSQGGTYGAGIGSGYDTHCPTYTDVEADYPICTINIKGNSVINATGGKYAAGVGTGYHHAGLDGVIEESVTVNAVSGDKFYKDTYTTAMDIGFGVVDPKREAKENPSSINYKGTEIGIPTVLSIVNVTPDSLSSITFASNTKYNLSGDFGGALVNLRFNANGLGNVVIDGTNATNIQELLVTANTGVLDGYSATDDHTITGSVLVTNFTGAKQLSIFAYDTNVEISDNKAEYLYVLARNVNINIHDNEFDANFTKHTVHNPGDLGEYAWQEYAITLNICEYNLKFDNNTLTDASSHVLGINGYEATYATQNGSNVISSFTGNNITVNSTAKTNRAAFKIWADVVYAPQNSDHSTVNAASQALIDTILTTAANNTFTVVDGQGHTIFCIYDANVNQ